MMRNNEAHHMMVGLATEPLGRHICLCLWVTGGARRADPEAMSTGTVSPGLGGHEAFPRPQNPAQGALDTG